MRRVLLFLTLVLALAPITAAQRRGVTAEDYFAFEQAGDPQISPDGNWAAHTVTTIDQKANRRFSRIWMVALDGSHPAVPFTGESASSSSPRWSRTDSSSRSCPRVTAAARRSGCSRATVAKRAA